MTTDNRPVTRAEFEATMRRIEALLDKQTEILQSMAVTGVENRVRDQLLAELKNALGDLQAHSDKQDQKFAWYAGAIAALGAAWPMLAKKLGLM